MAYSTLAELAGALGEQYLGHYLALSKAVEAADVLRFDTSKNGRVTFKRFDTLPEAVFRKIGEEPSALHAQSISVTVDTKILSYRYDLDQEMIARSSKGAAAELAAMREIAAYSIGRTFTKYFFNGDASSQGEEFDGLKAIASAESSEVSMATNGAVLSLEKLDEAIDLAANCFGSDTTNVRIFLNATHARKIHSLVRALNYEQYGISYKGGTVATYQGIPLIVVRNDAAGNAILPFTETQGTSSVASSLYIVKFAGSPADPGLFGVQREAPYEKQETSVIGAKFALHWPAALAINHKYAVVRLKGILAA